MANPVVAIVGRPNVGKSTVFNRIAGERISIVEDTPGVTRDRIYAKGEWLGQPFNLIDTGGIDMGDEPFLAQITEQAQIAIDEADVIVFVTSVKEGVTDADEKVAKILYRTDKPVILAVNKVDNSELRSEIYDFYSLGFGDRQILDGVNLTVKDGEILCIVGPSGAGKTTLLRCITGLETPDSGEFFINGRRFDPQGTDSADRVIGVVFQDFKLFPNLSVMENITLAPMMVLKKDKQEAIADAQKLLEELGLNTKGKLYPYQLSGGQKQRVAIARALAMKPKILCYDEPTSALDPNLRKDVANIILGLKKDGMTQLIVTHDLEFAEDIADDILRVQPLDQRQNK